MRRVEDKRAYQGIQGHGPRYLPERQDRIRESVTFLGAEWVVDESDEEMAFLNLLTDEALDESLISDMLDSFEACNPVASCIPLL